MISIKYKTFVSFLLILSLFSETRLFGQTFTTESIAGFEKNACSRIISADNASEASGNFDVNYYRCEWEVDPAVRYIQGKVTVYFRMTSASNAVTLDLMSPLVTDSVIQRNNQLLFSQTSNALIVQFGQTNNKDVSDSISIYYHGVPPTTGFGSFILSTHSGTKVMWTLSEPYGARDWWPCKNGLDDKADSIDVFIKHPAIYKAASNGMLQSETLTEGDTKMITHWKHRYPIATYLICMAVTNYTVFNNSVMLGSENVPMITYCYPENLIAFQSGTQNTLDAMQLYHNTFGPYPFIKEKYGHVQFGWGGGMEHQTSTFVNSTDEGLVAHELAHQWFGDKLTCGSWKDIWLNEGFATYLARFYMENKYPETAIANRIAVVKSITSSTNGSVMVDDTTNVGRIFSGRLSYSKGSFLLNMLRLKLGDDAFFNGIRKYVADTTLKYNFARTSDLQRHLEENSGKSLDNFFNQWYIGQGYPSYDVRWSSIGSANVKITVNQTTSDASVPFFEITLPLTFKNATQQKTIYLDNTNNGEIFLRNIGFIPDTVLIDAECQLISKNNSTEKIIVENTGNAAVEVYPNPIQNPLTIYLHDCNSSEATVLLYAMNGQLVFKQKYTLYNGAEILNLNFNNLAKGQYILKIIAGDYIHTQKMIK